MGRPRSCRHQIVWRKCPPASAPAVPRMLDLFERHGIRATWATVGFVFWRGQGRVDRKRAIAAPVYMCNLVFPTTAISPKSVPAKSRIPITSVRACSIGSPMSGTRNRLAQFFPLLLSGGGTNFRGVRRRHSGCHRYRKAARHNAQKSFVFPRNQYSDGHLGVLTTRDSRSFGATNAPGPIAPPTARAKRRFGVPRGLPITTKLHRPSRARKARPGGLSKRRPAGFCGMLAQTRQPRPAALAPDNLRSRCGLLRPAVSFIYGGIRIISASISNENSNF